MGHRRFLNQTDRDLPRQTSAEALPSSGFMVCPLAVQQWAGPALAWQGVYARALEEARAVVRPSILQRFAASLDN